MPLDSYCGEKESKRHPEVLLAQTKLPSDQAGAMFGISFPQLNTAASGTSFPSVIQPLDAVQLPVSCCYGYRLTMLLNRSQDP